MTQTRSPEAATIADLYRGRSIARWVGLILAAAIFVLSVSFSVVLINQHANDVYTHRRADKQDQWRCLVARQEHYPHPERWCS